MTIKLFQKKERRIGPGSKNGREEKQLFILSFQLKHIYFVLQFLIHKPGVAISPFQGWFLEGFLNVCETQKSYESYVACRKHMTLKGLIYDLLSAKTHVLPVPSDQWPIPYEINKSWEADLLPLVDINITTKRDHKH